LNYCTLANELPALKKKAQPLTTIHSQVVQDVLKRLERAYANFFRRVQQKKKGKKIKAGFPRFKGIGRYRSFTYPSWGNGVSLDGDILHLSKIGDIRIRLHRVLEGTPKTATISKKADGWYVSIACKVEEEPLPKTGKDVGIDVGIENFATLSDDNDTIPNSRFLQKAQAHLRVCQRRLERRSRYSGRGKKRKLLSHQRKRRDKARVLLAKAHQNVARARKDFHHKVAYALVHAFDTIYIENLSIGNMLKNHCLARAISDVAWGQFFQILKNKAERAAKIVMDVAPYNTSQICSGCGRIVPKALSCRVHRCPYADCGLNVHRDKNSAEQIRKVGRDAALSR
jgi:putative transposase